MERQHQNHMEHSNREPCPCLRGNAFMVPQKGEGRKRQSQGVLLQPSETAKSRPSTAADSALS